MKRFEEITQAFKERDKKEEKQENDREENGK